jgi:N-acyl-D-aspartate/D-glutamate deacylase
MPVSGLGTWRSVFMASMCVRGCISSSRAGDAGRAVRQQGRQEETLKKLFRDKRAVGNLADSGAHGKMLCGIGDNLLLLTKYVRDEHYLKIEEAIHILTGQPAEHFGMHDRGVINAASRPASWCLISLRSSAARTRKSMTRRMARVGAPIATVVHPRRCG